MAKTYTISSSRYTGFRGYSGDSNYPTFENYSAISSKQGYAGRESDYYATSCIFNTSSVSGKTITGVKLRLSYQNGRGSTVRAWTKSNSSTSDWRTTGGSAANATLSGSGTYDFNVGSLPAYGYVFASNLNSPAANSYIIVTGASLIVTTNETDYSYTLSYNANGGSGAPSAQTGSNTATSPSYTFTVSNTAPTRTGYTFLGWSTSSSATAASYSGGSSITVTSSGTTTLYAVWKINTYTVTYNKGSYGSGTNTTDTKTYNVNLTLKGAIFTRAGYEQVGWSTSDGGAQAYAVGGTYTANAAVTLYPVWSATTSTITTTNGTLGTQQTITITRYNSSYTHTLSYAYGAATGTIATGVGTSYNWTPPVSLASQFPSATSGTCVITCETFSEATSLGTTATSISLAIPSTVKCTVSGVTLTETVAGINAKFGSFVQGKSKAQVDIVPSTSNAYGATVTAYRTQINGQTLNTDLAVTGLLNTSGSNSYTATITDTRGRTDSYNGTFTVLEYNAPSISMTAQRNLSDLTAIDVNYSWNVSAVGNNNDKTVVIKYRVYGSSATPTVATTVTPGTYSGNGSYQITGLDADTAYDIWVELTDYFTTVIATGSVSGNSNRVFHVSATDGTVASHMANPTDGWDHNANKMRFHDDVQVDGDLAVGGDVSITGSLTGGGVVKTVNNVSPDASGNVTITAANVGALSTSGGTVTGNITQTGNNSITGDVSINGVLDLTQRRCSATLSSAGWYRVMQTKEVSGTIIDFRIGRPYDANPAEAHKISFHIVGGGKSAFLDETSDTNTLCVDKIRATYGGGLMYFDVHYNTSSANEVLVYFDVYGKGQANGTSIAMGLESVADAPAGETVLTTHSFAANTELSEDATSDGVRHIIKRTGKIVVLTIESANGKSCSAGTYTTVYTLPDWAKPWATVYTAVDTYGGDNIICGMITSSGDVQLYPVLRSTAYYRLTVTYYASN